jgi:hypothetical protein
MSARFDRTMSNRLSFAGSVAEVALDPATALASILASSPGTYALLIGSGVSRSSGIPTGWEISIDLIRRVASADGQEPDDPVSWYNDTYGDQADYSDIIEALAPGSGDRQALLDAYFEPTDEEREEGKKQPTAAHRAIAELVRTGAIRVIVTTNFDRLIERALSDVGIEPTVIASEADAQGAAPLHTMSAVVIKVHGDRRSPNIRNTVAELESYEPALEELVAQVFSEYGLVVVGWSAEWDAALRKLLVDHQPSVFTTFFAHRGPPGHGGQEVMKARMAIPVPIEDADSFFDDLVESVAAIAAARPEPSAVSQARLKLLMADTTHRIQLQDAVMEAIERLIAATSVEFFPTSGMATEDVVAVFGERLKSIETLSEEVVGLLSTLAYYADTDAHDQLLLKALTRLGSRKTKGDGFDILIPLQRYHATLSLYAAGIASIAAERLVAVATALATVAGMDETMVKAHGIGWWLAPLVVIDETALRSVDPDLSKRRTAVSDYVYELLSEALSPLIRSRDELEGFFDDFEYLMGLAGLEASGRWGPSGRFMWRRDSANRGSKDGVVDRFEEQLVIAGFADGDRATLAELREKYSDQLQQHGR